MAEEYFREETLAEQKTLLERGADYLSWGWWNRPKPKDVADQNAAIDRLRDSMGRPEDYKRLNDALKRYEDGLQPKNAAGSYRGTTQYNKLVLVDVGDVAESAQLFKDRGIRGAVKEKDRQQWLSEHALVCHYNPTTVTERIRPNYLVTAPLPGSFTQGMIFRWMQPRQIQLRLFFNDWGDERYAPFLSTQQSITWLKTRATIPFQGDSPIGDASKYFTGSGPRGQEHTHFTVHPAVVMLRGSPGLEMIGVITQLTIRHMKMTPDQLVTIRAEIDLELTQQAFATTPFAKKTPSEPIKYGTKAAATAGIGVPRVVSGLMTGGNLP